MRFIAQLILIATASFFLFACAVAQPGAGVSMKKRANDSSQQMSGEGK